MSRQYKSHGRDQFNIETLKGDLQVDNRTNAQQSIEVLLKGTIAPKHSSEKWVKRQQVEAELMRRLEAQVLLEMLGQGGFGKTDLAAWLYAQKKADFERSLWVDAAKVESFNQFARWVLQELRYLIDQRWNDEALIHELARRLTEHRCLLVVDQAEQLTESAIASFDQFVQYWQERGERSFLLVTTRRKVVTDERSRLALSGLTDAEGADFLAKQGIGAIADQGLVRLTQLANGHPLLLGLAASWVRQEARGCLDEPGLEFFQRLFSRYQGDSEAKVEEIFAVLFAELPERLRWFLMNVVVYRDPFDLDMAKAMVANLSIDDLRTLEEQAFLQSSSNRWTLHSLMQRLIQVASIENGLNQWAHQKAIAYFAANIQPWTGLLSDCAAELEIFHHRCELGEYALAYQVMDTCLDGLDRRGYYRDLLPIYQQLTHAWTDASPEDTEEQRKLGWAWAKLGTLYYYVGQHQDALVAYTKAQIQFDKLDFAQEKADSLTNLGNVYSCLGQHDRAIDFHQQSLAIKREIGDRDGEGGSLCNLGSVYFALEQYQQAIKHYEQALVIQREIGNRDFESNSLGGLGSVYQSLGQYDRAIDFYQQSLEIKREIGNRRGEANSLSSLSDAYYWLGQYDRAIDFYQQSLEIKREIGNRREEAESLGNLGLAYHSLGQYDSAIDFHQQSLEIEREIGDRNGEGGSLCNLGNAYKRLGQIQQSIEYYQQALIVQREVSNRNFEGNSLIGLGSAYYSLGRYDRAIDFYRQSLEIKREIGDRNSEATALSGLGDAHYSLGQYARAIDFYRQSLEIQREIGDRRGEAASLFNLSNIYQQCGQFKRARFYRHQAYRIWQELDLPLEALPFSDFQKRLLRNLGDDWIEQQIENERKLAWFLEPLGLILFSIRWLLSPIRYLQKRLKPQK